MPMFNTGPSQNPYGGWMQRERNLGMQPQQNMGAMPQNTSFMASPGMQPGMQSQVGMGSAGPNPDQLQMLLKLLQGSNSSMQPMGGGFKPMNMNPGIQL